MAFINSFKTHYKNLSDNLIGKALTPSSYGSALTDSFDKTKILPVGSTTLEKSASAKIPDFRREDKYGQKREEDVFTIAASTMRKMYKFNPIVRAAVDTIINSIISAKWQIAPIDVETDITPKIQSKIDEITYFFRHPNKNSENFKSLLRKVLLDILVLDAGVLEKVHFNDVEKKGLAELYVVDGSTIRIKVDEYGDILEYWQVLEGKDAKPIRFNKKDLMYIQNWSRSYSIYGMSPLETLHNSVTAFLYGESYNIKFFENNATPKGIIDLGGTVPEKELDRFRQFWEAEQQQKPHRLMILGNIGTPEKAGSGVKWIPIAMQPKDYDMGKYLDWLMKIILMVFGVNPSTVGWTEEIKGAPATGQMLQSQAFKERAIYPIMERLAWYFTEEIVHDEFGSDLLKFEFIEEVSLQDRLIKAQIHQFEIMGNWKTPDEIRKEEGLKPMEQQEGMSGSPEEEAKPDIEGILSELKGEEKKTKEQAYSDLETNIKDYIDQNSKVTDTKLQGAFDDLSKKIKDFVGKSIKGELSKSLKFLDKKGKKNVKVRES